MRPIDGTLRMALVLGFVAGVTICGLGVWLVYLGSTGPSRIQFFGQSIDSTSVGVSALFIGATTLVLLFRRVLTSVDRTFHLPQPHNGESNVSSRLVTPPRAAGLSIESLDALGEIVSGLSTTQLAMLRHVASSYEHGVHIPDLQDTLGLSRQEVVYRARDLQSAGLVKIEILTDQCVFLSPSVGALLARSPGAVRAILDLS